MASLQNTKQAKEEAIRTRKVNPIYEALDSGNYKGALKLCAKKDIQDWDIVLCLKAHALERLGKSPEALELCQVVKERKPVDTSVLSTLALNFKLMDLRDDATECYENALSVQPQNVEMTQEVFLSYTRSFNYGKQQQFAMKLYKQIPSRHFLFWSATAMLLQVRLTKGAQAQMLVLSERLVQRALEGRREKGEEPSAQELLLFVEVLKQQGKLKEALSVVTAHKAGSGTASSIEDEDSLKNAGGVPSEALLMQPKERLALEARLRMDLHDFAGALENYNELIEQDNDEWSYHMGYFDALFQLEDGSAMGQQKPRIDTFQQTWPKARTAYLVEMDLITRLSLERGDDNSLAPLPELILKYLNLFSHKLCCFADLEPYLKHLKGPLLHTLEARVEFLLEQHFPDQSLEVVERIEKLHRYICCRQCLRYLQREKEVTCDVLRSAAATLFDLFVNTLDVNDGAKGGQREVQHGDELVLLAVHMLRDAAKQADTQSRAHQCHLDAALILHFGSTCSPFNFHFNLCLIEEFRELGCFEQSILLFKQLAVKHIQLDSLSYLMTPGFYQCFLYNEAEKQCQQIIKFNKNATRDAGDYSVTAFENGNYSAVLELCEFQSVSLSQSAQLAAAYADLANLTIVTQKHTLHEAETFLEELIASKHLPQHANVTMDSLSFNHDFSVGLDWCGGVSKMVPKLKARIYRLIMLRSLLPHLLHKVTTTSDVATIEATQELDKFNRYCDSDEEEDIEIDLRVENLSWRLCQPLFKACFALKCWKNSAGAASEEEGASEVTLLQQATGLVAGIHALVKSVSPKVGSENTSESPPLCRVWLSACSAFVVTALPVLSLVLQQLMVSVTPVPKKKKNNKKKKNAVSEVPSCPLVEAAVTKLSQATVEVANEFLAVLERFDMTPSYYATTNATTCFPLLFSDMKFKECRDTVFASLVSSQKLSMKRAVPLLKAKIAVLLPTSE